MRTARHCTAVFLAALWLLPAVAACGIGMHVLLDHASGHHSHAHHSHADGEAHSEPHEHGSAEHTAALTDFALHGHHHGQHHSHAGAADHSHHVAFSPSKVWQRTNLVPQAIAHALLASPASLAPSRLPADLKLAPDRASPALFTAHCSLLI